MHVRPRPEIVALDLEDDVDPRELTGNYLSPKEFKEALLEEDTIVIDARNDYEYDLGHFRGAIRPDITRFRDLPDWIKENKEQFMDKKSSLIVQAVSVVKILRLLIKRRF